MDYLASGVVLSTSVVLITIALVTLNRIWNPLKSKGSSYPAPTSLAYPILGSLQYFTHRWDFLREITKTGPTSFHLAGQHVIALSSEQRVAFFSNPRLSFALAYAVMLGATPSMNKDFLNSVGFDITLGGKSNKRLLTMLHRERITNSLPTLLAYSNDSVQRLGESGTTNPFESIYAAIFQLTVRIIGSCKIAENLALCDEAREIFHELDNSGTPITVLFPWFFGYDRIRRFFLMRRFYLIVRDAVEDRLREGRRDEDPLQVLIDEGHSVLEIAQFTLVALFAGIANTGMMAAYLLCHLAVNPDWLAKVRAEVQALADRDGLGSSATLVQRLQSVTYDEWENELPIMSACLRESIRLHIATPLHRLNLTGEEQVVGGVRIPKNAIMTYHTSDVHHNPSIYPNPMVWDPTRYGPDRAEDKKQPMAFAGWGLGRHPCLGARFAKFEINMLAAIFVMTLDFELVDGSGQPVTKMPPASLKDQVVSPPEPSIHIKFSRRM